MVLRRALLALSLVIAGLCSLPAVAAAIPQPGENGRIVYITGPPFGNTLLHLKGITSSTGGPASLATGPLTTGLGVIQHRHPTWSPDRTKIAFAAGTAGAFKIYTYDLTTPNVDAVEIGSGDRPSWSPDGTKIAWETNDAASDIIVHTVGDGSLNLTTTQTRRAWKADWSLDSQTVYYSVGDITVAPNGNTNDVVLWQQPANNSTAGTQIHHVVGSHVFQPATSPDGTKLCYTISTEGAGLPNSASVVVAPLSNLANITIVQSSGVGDYNCAWSPDGTMVTYVEDYADLGDVWMEKADGTDPSPINLTGTNATFEGNPDWAPDGRPICDDQTVTTKVNQPVTFDVECTDTGPAYELTSVRDFKDSDPTNGTVPFPDQAGDPYTYTPNAGFVGTDSFRVQSFDEFGFGTDTGTITIEVQAEQPPPPPPPGAKCFGKDATITGTAGNDEIVGTPGDDVIAVLAGADIVRGGGGNDLICGGPQDDRLAGGAGRDRVGGGNGNDRVGGGAGNDRLAGNAGRDRANGGGGNDSLSGGGQNDRLAGGAGRDRIKGAQGRDRLAGNGGPDRLNGGGGRDRCAGGGGTDRGKSCERTTGIP